MNQFFNIIEVIIISNNSLTMVNNSFLFIFFKAAQQSFDTIPLGKYSKTIRLDFCEKTLLTIYFAKIAIIYIFFHGTFSVFAPIFIWTITRITATAMFIFRTQTTSQSATSDTKFSFHIFIL